MDANKKRRRPKLDRRNALKNIDYHAPPSSLTTSSSFDGADRSSPPPGLRTRSLELYHFSNNQTSFQVKGIEGELDLICRSLGLSGPEDFAIPTAAWEAQKARFSSHSHSSSSSQPDEPHDDHFSAHFQAVAVGPSGGIKGVRPPVMLRPNWDVLKSSFAPPPQRQSSDGEEEEEGVRLGETDCRLESCSSTSNYNRNNVGVISVNTVSPSAKFRRSIMSWQKGELLGSGSFGSVYEGFTEDGFFFAVKEVSLLDQGSQGKQSILQLEQEISLLSQFQHENIVRYLGTDKDESKLYIFLELVTKGSLLSLYHKYRLRDSQVSAYTRQILNGLMYLHDRDVVHRDIKCANILVDASGSVKLADFGLAKATKLNDVNSCKGTAFWMAPEVVNLKNRGYGLAADIWSLGCTVLEMLTRQPPYSHLEGMQALFMIGKGEPPPVPDSLSRDARDFIIKCIQVNPNDRPTAAQLLDHPFVRRPLQNSFGPVSPQCTGKRS